MPVLFFCLESYCNAFFVQKYFRQKNEAATIRCALARALEREIRDSEWNVFVAELLVGDEAVRATNPRVFFARGDESAL